MKLTQEQAKERDLLVFGKEGNWDLAKGGTISFEGMPVVVAQELVEKGYLDPKDSQNGSPLAQDFIDWAWDHLDPVEGVTPTFNGYVVAPERSDCRVTIDAIHVDWEDAKATIKRDVLSDFASRFHWADDFNVDTTSGFAWFD